jgi:rSAM/selenodomain-associated transferase 2
VELSVIIPVLNEDESILPPLFSVRNQRGNVEIIVVDGGSSDGTVEIARPHARVIIAGQGRGVQMNSGASRSSGDVLLFLHGDSCLHSEALSTLKNTMDDPRIAGGTFTLRFDSPKLLLRVIAFFTRFKFRYFHYGDQGIFVRRRVFEQLGGFKEIPLMEDIDFFLRLQKAGKVALIKRPVTTSARRFLKNGILRQQLCNIFLVIFYLLGAKPETLKRLYERTDISPGRQDEKIQH